MKDIPSDAFINKIEANFIDHGYGLQNLRGTLQIKTNQGLSLDEDGIGISLHPNSGLSVKSNKIFIDPSSMQLINLEGQNLSDNDNLIVGDVSRGSSRSTTLNNLYESYIKAKVPHPSGEAGSIQFKGKRNFESSTNLTYDAKNKNLNLTGGFNSHTITSKIKMVCQGSVYYNITKTNSKTYNVDDSDYTIICDAKNNVVNVVLPPAENNTGRVVIVKKSNSDTFKINSNKVNVSCEEGRIDLTDNTEIRMNYSSRTFQSDGENWHIIGTKGT